MNGTQRRFTVLISSLLLAGLTAVFAAWASADVIPVPTGSCARSYSVITPTTLSCSFTVSTDSNSFSGWTSKSWSSSANVNVLEIDVDGQSQPLNTCVGADSGCATTTFDVDLPAGTVINCTLRVVTGSGTFACESDVYPTG